MWIDISWGSDFDPLKVLIAMSPSGLKLRLPDLESGGIVIANTDSFGTRDLEIAGYAANPLEDGTLVGYRVIPVALTKLNREAVAESGLSPRESDRCRNFFALGLVFWLFQRPLESTEQWIKQKFARKEAVQKANLLALKAGYNYGEASKLSRLR
jgi:2-oxoglutarate ferredoxin oxidoreductase subunit alpha